MRLGGASGETGGGDVGAVAIGLREATNGSHYSCKLDSLARLAGFIRTAGAPWRAQRVKGGVRLARATWATVWTST